MKVLSAQNSAVMGIQRGLDALRKDAAAIASASASASADRLNKTGKETDLIGALVNLSQDKLQVQASARVVSTWNEVIGSIIDIRV